MSSEEERIQLLVKKRSYLKGRITLLERSIDGCDSDLTEDLAKARAIAVRLEDIGMELEGLDSTQMEEGLLLDAKLDSIVKRIRREIKASEENIKSDTSAKVKLPAIHLPVFDGAYGSWHAFKDLFTSMVHHQKDLSPVQKFIHLKSSLRGEAAGLVSTLECTNENYQKAWEALTVRYDNKALIANHHLSAILALPKVTKAYGLRNLCSEFSQAFNAVRSLNVDNLADVLLIHILSNKLDYATLRDFELQRGSEFPTLNGFLDFLHQRCQALEMIARDEVVRLPGATYKRTSNDFRPQPQRVERSASYHAAPATKNVSKKHCLFCNIKGHYLSRCKTFQKLSTADKVSFVAKEGICELCFREGHNSSLCPKKDEFKCRKCNSNAHSAQFCGDNNSTRCNLTTNNTNQTLSQEPHENAVSMVGAQSYDCVISLLPTVLCDISNGTETLPCRVLLDIGSQKNYITADCLNKFSVCKVEDVSHVVAGVGGHATKVSKKVDLTILAHDSDFKLNSKFGVLDVITDCLPSVSFPRKEIKLPKGIKLADSSFHMAAPIDIILGANDYMLSIKDGRINLGPGLPGLLNTQFGWVVCGDFSLSSDHSYSLINQDVCNFTSSLHEDIVKFWQIEDVPKKNLMSFQEKTCERIFTETVHQDDSGRFVVDLPVDADRLPLLGNSHNLAYRCFLSLEKKFKSNPEFHKSYAAFIKEYLELGHAFVVEDYSPHQAEQVEYYMPHHAVIKETSTSTKLRVVFNASAATSSGVSLNSALLVGPVVQPDMLTVLLKFRTYLYVFVADIMKMYRQIGVATHQQPLQRILWRDSPDLKMKCLQLTRLTYGTAPASYLATRVLAELASKEGNNFPLACKVLQESCYVDDVLHGANDLSTVVETIDQLQNLLKKGQFELHKYQSNSVEVLKNIPTEKREECTFTFDSSEKSSIKTLGIKWDPVADKLQIDIPKDLLSNDTKFTKRSVLSDIAKLFDPLGFIAPVILFAKLIMQDIYKESLGWDSPVSEKIIKVWKHYCETLHCLNVVSVPRGFLSSHPGVIELYGFADSSTKAYGCVIYARCCRENQITVHLVAAKSRVAPLKPVTLPRLELCAALLLTRLMVSVSQTLQVPQNDIYYWTDSMITLCWIQGDPSRWNVFVANRVAEIQENSAKENWAHVRTDENPADLVSRGLTPQDLVGCDFWFQGPSWLSTPKSEWHIASVSKNEISDMPEERQVSHVISDIRKSYLMTVCERSSSWSKLCRVFAYVRRFIKNCKPATAKHIGFLTGKELTEAGEQIIFVVQHDYFHRMIQQLEKDPRAGSTCKQLKFLSPFVDELGFLRVGGRLRYSNANFSEKHPLILPSHSHVTDLLILYEHRRLQHAGTQTTLSSLRKYVWPLQGRRRVRHLIFKCIICYRFQGEAASQKMADLPRYRVTPNRPFLRTGLDFAGPIPLKLSRIRSPIISKGYICIFVCMSTKAIHIELVSDLTTKEFLNALRRLMARRGKCLQLFSDNGTTFQGANNELNSIYRMFKDDFESISDFVAGEKVEWNFIPPRSPHWGGLWESSVKLVKHHLRRVLGNTVLDYEHLNTLLICIEAIVNSRPLTALKDDATDDLCLTPSHFLVGESLASFPEGDLSNIPTNRLKIYKQLNQMRDIFWKRWRADYLNTLQVRYKWYVEKPDLLMDAVVLLKEDNLPPLSWPLGRVVKLFHGKDNKVRSAQIKTKNGLFVRPIVKLVPLPFDSF